MADSRSYIWASDRGSILPHRGCHRTSFLSPRVIAFLSVSNPLQEVVEVPCSMRTLPFRKAGSRDEGGPVDVILVVRTDGERWLQRRVSSITQDHRNVPLR